MGQTLPFSLGRIIIFGHRVDLLKAFYVDNFHFSVVEETPGQWIVLNAGPVELAIHKIGQAYEPESGQAFRVEGNTKLVFYLDSHLKDFRQRLVEKGVVMREVKSFPGISSVFCDGEDPEGNVFQLEQRIVNL